MFGLGYLPVAPGTWGSLGALLVWAPFRASHPAFEGPGIVLLSLLAVHAAGHAARVLRTSDPSVVVIDEAAGMALTLVALPSVPSLLNLGLAFLLFRLFDVVKPFPLRRLERFPGGWGIVLDDLGAGLYAAVILSALTSG